MLATTNIYWECFQGLIKETSHGKNTVHSKHVEHVSEQIRGMTLKWPLCIWLLWSLINDHWPGSQTSAHSGVSLGVSSLCRAGVCGAADVSAELPWLCEGELSPVCPRVWTSEEFEEAFGQNVYWICPTLHWKTQTFYFYYHPFLLYILLL